MILNQEQVEIVTPLSRTIQLICFALIMGVSMAAIILFAVTDWQSVTTELDMMSLIGVIVGMAIFFKSLILPRIVGNSAVRLVHQHSPKSSNERVEKLANAYQTKTLIQFALIEGAAFLNLILFWLSKSIVPLGVVAAAIVLMVLIFPRSESIQNWIAERME